MEFGVWSWMKKLFFIVGCLLIAATGFSQTHFDAGALLNGPVPKQLVNDYTYNTLTPEQLSALEYKLNAFNDSTSNEVAVAIIPSLDGNDVADYTVNLFRHWGIGKQKNNNGVLLLIAVDDRKLNITTGYGLEGALPDITCKQIIDDVIVPRIKDNDFYRAIDEGTDQIMDATHGEYASTVGAPVHHGFFYWVWKVIKWIFWILVILFLISKGWLGPILNIGFTILTSSGSSSGSGGFGGFGGGSSGGGGASGSW